MNGLRRGRWAPALLLACCATACGGTSASSGPGTTPAIVFSADRGPLVDGEIYRVDPGGRTVDLSKSPFQDADPLVSPDGRRVAFISNRDHHGGLYVVGIDGKNLTKLQAPAINAASGSLAWAPDGKAIAVLANNGGSTGTLLIARPGRAAQVVARGAFSEPLAWSPDSRLLTVWAGTGEHPVARAFSAEGAPRWSAPVFGEFPTWSKIGLFEAVDRATVRVYDERGRVRFAFRGRTAAWSPAGTRLGSVAGGRVEVRTQAGRVVFTKTVANLAGRRAGLVWIDARRVVLVSYPRRLEIDTVTGRTSKAGLRIFDPRSPDGRFVAVTPKSGSGFALRVVPLVGTGSKSYGTLLGCTDDGTFVPARAALQFVPHRPSLVYGSYCPSPASSIYAVDPDGTGLRQLTHVQQKDLDPDWSPDGKQIVFARFDGTGLDCHGCTGAIYLANANGDNVHLLTIPTNTPSTGASFYAPSWSPDDKHVLFSSSSFTGADELLTVMYGEAPHDLHLTGTNAAWGASRIAWVDNAGGELWTAAPDGNDRTKVAQASGKEPLASPAWSHDGRLAYLDGTTLVVGSQKVRLPFAEVGSLAWSPDGSRFVVSARTAGAVTFDLYSIRTDGTDSKRLTTDFDALTPSWR